MSDNPTITCTPTPPIQGKKTTIHYSGTSPQSLTVETVPPGLITSPITTDPNGDYTFTMPDTCTAITVSGGGATAFSSVVNAP